MAGIGKGPRSAAVAKDAAGVNDLSVVELAEVRCPCVARLTAPKAQPVGRLPDRRRLPGGQIVDETLIALHGDPVPGSVVVARFARCKIDLQQMSGRQILRKRQARLQIPFMHRHRSPEGDTVLSREVGRGEGGNPGIVDVVTDLLTELVAGRC